MVQKAEMKNIDKINGNCKLCSFGSLILVNGTAFACASGVFLRDVQRETAGQERKATSFRP